MQFEKIQAVTLDVGGTLIEPFPSVGAVYAQAAREHGFECCAETLTRQFGNAWISRDRFEYSRQEWFEIVQDSFRGFAQVTDELFSTVYNRFTRAAAWRLFEDVRPALTQIRARGIKIAVISNWDDRLEPLLADLGILHFFDHISVSGKLGRHKPDIEIFRHSIRALGIAPMAALHVGDSFREDVQGAQTAGMRAVRIRRNTPAQCNEISELTYLAEKLGLD
jgi:putative hydrolase of the HAD superfamily